MNENDDRKWKATTDNTNNNTFDAVKEAVNGHNKYFTEYDGNSNGFKNYITHNSIKISSDIINLIESESSVDDQPDIKNIGESNTNAKRRLDSLSGNSTNTYSLFNSAQVGKDVVSITAAGLKNFFVITHSYNMKRVINDYNMLKLDSVSDDDVKSILGNIIRHLSLNNGKGVEVGDKTYYVSSNLNPTDETKDIINEIASNDVYLKIIDDLDLLPAFTAIVNAARFGSISKNNAIVLSALLSEATNNIKDLSLSKINATKDMVPLYIFGLTISMDVADIAKIMQSATARVFNRIKHGNVYYSNSSSLSVSSIYSTIDRNGNFDKILTPLNNTLKEELKEITLSNLAKKLVNSDIKDHAESGNKILKLIDMISKKFDFITIGDISFHDFIIKNKLSLYNSRGLNYISVFNDYDYSIQVLKAFKLLSKVSYTIRNNYGQFTNLIDNLITTINDRRTIENDNGGKNINAIKKLDNGNKEMLKISLFTSLNKGVKTTLQDIIKYNTKLGDIVTFNPSEDDKTKEDYKTGRFLKTGNDNMFTDSSKSTSKFNLNLFVNNSSYRNKAIAYYAEKYQVAFNVLEIASQMPHILSYAKTANKANSIVNNMSPKKKLVNDFVDAVINFIGHGIKTADKNALIRSSNKFINNILFNSWLRSINGGIRFYIPKGGKYYVNNLGNAHSLTEKINTKNEPIEMVLGSDTSNASFIEYMNSYVIPNLKSGVLSDDGSNSIIMNNSFINSLHSFTSDKVYTGSNVQVYAPPVSLRSNDEIDIMKTTEYKIASKGLSGIKYINNGKSGNNTVYTAANLLYLYNQILYSGTINDASLDEYFKSSSLKTQYLTYEADVAKSKTAFNKAVPNFKITNDTLMEVAPISNGQNCGLPYHKVYNHSTMQFLLLKKAMQNTSNNENREYIEEVLGYINDSDYQDNMENEGRYYSYNESKYEVVDEILSDNSFTATYDYDSIRKESDDFIEYNLREDEMNMRIDKSTNKIVCKFKDSKGVMNYVELSNNISKQIFSLMETNNDNNIVAMIKEIKNIKNNCN